ncbi:aldose 1-epimerase family protein [Sphingomonas aracearum]|uniref:Aldose 1-epimerase family protein n=1 Tax=Sphingomonas aracearum TaxID=2283317 RepID=A0A369VUF5_9SPHN|nr:aldose 1-epimerase family protein [Sphingomonas aracearum]RDE05978.1 aldose 1-epimerase family protein [Sphingomonas aracearum]
MSQLLPIASDALRAEINPFGAELTHLRTPDGAEWMTDADPAYWTGHAPILFPIVGALAGNTLRVDGGEYRLERHGFARRRLFEVAAHEESRLVLRLADDEETRAVYPFAFLLEMTYALEGATLHMTARIENRGGGPLPASFGWHPAFAWPLPGGGAREAHCVRFARDEPAGLKPLAPDGTILPGERPSPLDGRVLHLDDDVFASDALIWDPVASRSVVYAAPEGPALQIDFPDTPRLGIWSKPGARFVCVEPWHGIADPQGYAGDFRDKPGVFEIAPGADRLCSMAVTVRR